jgi:hypothetical protein
MMSSLVFNRFRVRPENWDALVSGYPGKTLFHELAWHRHVLDIHPAGQFDYFEILRQGRRVGLHCGLRVRKLGLPIHGSPLGGTGTNFIGPVVESGIDQLEVVRALRGLMGPRNGLHLEVAHYRLDPSIMTAAGYDVHPTVTHLIKMPATEGEAWDMLKSTCRNRVRKAQQNGLTVRVATDAAVADRFFEQFIEVYGKQGMVTPFGIDRPRSLFAQLNPAGRLLPLEVLHEGNVLATGLFPFDDSCIYFWGAGSWLSAQHLCPNEFLHWEVMRFAVGRGIRAYNMCGGGSQFKDKFGGSDVPYTTYSVSALPGLRTARAWYKRLHFARLKRQGERAGLTPRSAAPRATE